MMSRKKRPINNIDIYDDDNDDDNDDVDYDFNKLFDELNCTNKIRNITFADIDDLINIDDINDEYYDKTIHKKKSYYELKQLK